MQVILVPADNPFLLPLPDLSSGLNLESGEMQQIVPGLDITNTQVITPTLQPNPSPTPTLTP